MRTIELKGQEVMVISQDVRTDPKPDITIFDNYDDARHYLDTCRITGAGVWYVSDERFTTYYDKMEPGLTVFMLNSMKIWATNNLV